MPLLHNYGTLIISIVNQARSHVPDAELQRVIRAINRQIESDFAPYWGMPATVRLEGSIAKRPRPVNTTADMRGDAVIYVWYEIDPDEALGYHSRNYRNVPFGVVFVEMSKKLDEPYSVTLSHEVLETIADPYANLYVSGPHPGDGRHKVLYSYEVCDPVQTQTYDIDGVKSSNFVLPSYFCPLVAGARNDFLGEGLLPPFGVAEGGYVNYFDPRKHRSFDHFADAVAKKRVRVKRTGGNARRLVRYQFK